MPKWTQQQLEAIEDRGRSLIVCAAAGSGKTAVLTERIVRLVGEGTPLSSMLVVTFTRAAAGEMRARIASALREAALKAGFNAAACATNHVLDAGAEGINTTAAFYEERGVPCLGILPEWKNAAEEPPYHLFTQDGIRIAVFDYTYGTNFGDPEGYWPGAVHLLKDEETVREEIASARRERGGNERTQGSGTAADAPEAIPAADAVIVLVHWGTEYSQEPDEEQRRWAKVFYEAEADVVVGSHPHVLQPLEILNEADFGVSDDSAPDEAARAGGGRQMPVFWSLGNLVSRQDRPECVLGGLAEFTVRRFPGGCEVTDCRLVPVITHQTEDATTVWLLEDYTEEKAAEHRLDVCSLLPGVVSGEK